MKLVVGLGNPGKEYKKTRHNVGFMVLDNYLGKVDWKKKYEAEIFLSDINGEQVLFVKPLTYMNLSGLALKKIVRFYKIDMDNILVIQDDLDLKMGTYKLKKKSSSGGHNGIKSIINELNSDEFMRLKIGIDKSSLIPSDKYVTSNFSSNELSKLKANFDLFNDIINCFIMNNGDECMQKYN